jgi:hypothetical protein
VGVGERGEKFGPYVYTAELGVLRVAADCVFARWASVHEMTGTSHLVYQMLGPARDKFTRRKFLRAAAGSAGECGPHALGITAYALQASGRACLVSRYPGDLGGVTTLRQHVKGKGGRLGPNELARAVEHLIDALAAGAQGGTVHGAFDLDGCVVDRGGRVAIELFGFGPRWMRPAEDQGQFEREQRGSLATAVRDMGGVEGEAWEAWSRMVEMGASWDEVRRTMPRGSGGKGGGGASMVRTLWDALKQVAARG